MKKIELTFDEAWEYLKFLVEIGYSKKAIADYIGTNREAISAAMTGQIEPKTNKPRKLAKKYHDKIIELVQVLQLEAWRKKKKDEQT